MPETNPTEHAPSLATLVGGLVEDTQQLVRQEAALARHEIQAEWDKTKQGAALLGVALAFLALVGVLFAFTLVKLLYQYVLPHDEWACFAIITVLFAVCGGLLYFAARERFEQIHLPPRQSVESIRADVQAVTSAVTAERPQGAHALMRQR
jgi:hypothetical protein